MSKEESNQKVSLDIAADSMSATLTLNGVAPTVDKGDAGDVDGVDGAESELVSMEECLALVKSNGVKLEESAESEIHALLNLHHADPSAPHSVVVATGSSPIPGDDGRLVFNEGFDPDADRTAANEKSEPGDDQAVDYYNRSAFCLVNVGDKIGRLCPPGDGEPGATVTGESLPAQPGTAFTLKVDDADIEVKPDGWIIARQAGLLWRDGDALMVRTELDVPGFVDFSTGNIMFPGDVEIKEGVRDCFVVEVTGSVIIHGLVEAATIRAGLDASLLGGMAAREKGKVDVGRDLSAHYLNGVEGKVGQNLVIDKEIINCQLVVKGALVSENAAVAGGRVLVGKSVMIGELGADSGTPTELAIGMNAEVESKDAEIQSMLEKIQERAAGIQPEHDTLQSNERKLSKDQQKRYRELRKALRELGELESSVYEAQETLHAAADRCVKVDVTVQRMIQPGLRMCLGDVTADFNDELPGPVRFFRDDHGEIVVQDLRSGDPAAPLNTVARVCRVHEPKETDGEHEGSHADETTAAA